MHTLQNVIGYLDFWYPYVLIIIIWDIVWRLFTMWKAGRNNDLIWFLCIAILSTLGILPIIYFFTHRNKSHKLERGI